MAITLRNYVTFELLILWPRVDVRVKDHVNYTAYYVRSPRSIKLELVRYSQLRSMLA